ncbi:MAG TPA: IclR family transcriptional regulator C-terminal domain-containing protein [Candidatus Limnocylindrales bacterium]|nr:IclR family transcriptional regulator C-terminal domain-containing protein [Candidatus Limnocylindrales bacterium]
MRNVADRATARDRPPEEAAEDTSFARGLRVLLAIADRGEIRADELSAVLETPVSTVYRYLRTLSDFGFVDRGGVGYRLGPRLTIASGTGVTTGDLIRTAGPILELLAEESGETAVMVRRIGLSAVCLHEVPSSRALRVTLPPPSGLPLDRGALGLALLAFAPPEIVDEVLAAEAEAGREAVDEGQLRADLATIVATGIARTEGDAIPGAVALAVPVLREDGIVAAVGVIGPATRCGHAWRTRMARLLPASADAIIGSLGAGRSSFESHPLE